MAKKASAQQSKTKRLTTLALGEENVLTTLAVGEEVPITTLAIGEETLTTLVVGEEGSPAQTLELKNPFGEF